MLSGTRQDRPLNLLRPQGASARVTNVELFFDLVYVFAVTQLSHYLVDHQSAEGALQALLLLAMVWQGLAYTTWLTSPHPERRIPGPRGPGFPVSLTVASLRYARGGLTSSPQA